MNAETRNYCDGYLQFLRTAVCAPWTARSIVELARASGFKDITQNKQANVAAGSRWFINDDFKFIALIAAGTERPEKVGLKIVTAYIDNPELTLKPNWSAETAHISVEANLDGEAASRTWFNQLLGIAGRVYNNGSYERHTQRKLNGDENWQQSGQHFFKIEMPGLMLAPEADVRRSHVPSTFDSSDLMEPDFATQFEMALRENGVNLNLFAQQGEFYLYPLAKPQYFGIGSETILAQRHDDRSMCFASLIALMEAVPAEETCLALFFNRAEAVGGDYGGTMLARLKEFLLHVNSRDEIDFSTNNSLEQTLTKSSVLSLSLAHPCALRPVESNEPKKAAVMGNGPALFIGQAGCVDEGAQPAMTLQDIAHRHNLPLQLDENAENVSPVPLFESGNGMQSLGAGLKIAPMHGDMELAACSDLYYSKELLRHFFCGQP